LTRRGRRGKHAEQDAGDDRERAREQQDGTVDGDLAGARQLDARWQQRHQHAGLLIESVLLSLAGGIAGIGVAVGGVRLLRGLATTVERFDLGVGTSFPRVNEIAIDGTVLAVTFAVAVVTGVLFGLAPAVRQRRAGTASRLIVVAEVAAAMVLLVGSGLLIRSFATLSAVDVGYDAEDVLTFQVSVPLARYPDDARLKTFAEDLTARLRGVPGVELAGYAKQVPLVGIRDTGGGLWRTPDPNPRQQPGGPNARVISRDYLQVMGIRVVAGRGFTAQDDAGAPKVLLVNETLARQQFAGASPLGQLVYVGRDPEPWQTVGVVDDVRQFALDREPEPQYFIDMRQWPLPFLVFPTGASYVVRCDGAQVRGCATAWSSPRRASCSALRAPRR